MQKGGEKRGLVLEVAAADARCTGKQERFSSGQGVSITASVEFTRKDLRHEGKVKDLIERIQAAGSG